MAIKKVLKESAYSLFHIFTATINSVPLYVRVFVTVSHFQPCLIFVTRGRVYPSGTPKGTQLLASTRVELADSDTHFSLVRYELNNGGAVSTHRWHFRRQPN
jgi:hypothetical protein